MPDVVQTILSNIEDDPIIKVKRLDVRIIRGKGLFNRRKIIEIRGTADTDKTKGKIGEIAARWGGENFDIANEITVQSS